MAIYSEKDCYYYKGGWSSNLLQMNGLGHLFLLDNNNINIAKESYFGYFLSSNFHSLGIKLNNEGYNYIGEFRDGKETGYCVAINYKKPFLKYEGLVINNIFEGFGELTSENSFYSGTFSDGKKSGIGYYISETDSIEYVGGFENNMFNSFGFLKFLDLSNKIKQQLRSNSPYKNRFKNNNYNSISNLNKNLSPSKDSDGNTASTNINSYSKFKELYYYGEFVNNKMDGFGKLVFVNGDEYIGHFNKGIYHGYGEFKNASGKTLKGNWVDGKKQDWFEFISIRDVFYVKFKNDVQISTSKICPYK